MAETGLRLDAWITRVRREGRRRPARCGEASAGLRFAFYGRTSTVRFQDRWTSRGLAA